MVKRLRYSTCESLARITDDEAFELSLHGCKADVLWWAYMGSGRRVVP